MFRFFIFPFYKFCGPNYVKVITPSGLETLHYNLLFLITLNLKYKIVILMRKPVGLKGVIICV